MITHSCGGERHLQLRDVDDSLWLLTYVDGPVCIGVALLPADVRSDVARWLALGYDEQLRESVIVGQDLAKTWHLPPFEDGDGRRYVGVEIELRVTSGQCQTCGGLDAHDNLRIFVRPTCDGYKAAWFSTHRDYAAVVRTIGGTRS